MHCLLSKHTKNPPFPRTEVVNYVAWPKLQKAPNSPEVHVIHSLIAMAVAMAHGQLEPIGLQLASCG